MNHHSVKSWQVIRPRWIYALAALAVIGLGLASRSEKIGLPWFVAKYLGDSLWGLVVFIGLGFLFPRQSTRCVTALAMGFACSVEFSQLFHPSWLDAIRSNRLGGLVLGTPSSTFAWGDIAAYFVGITCGVVVELVVFRKARQIESRQVREDGPASSD
jgi:Protein of unknown function (DUF2809)